MEALCSSAFAMDPIEYPTALEDVPGIGINLGMGMFLSGLIYGIVEENNMTNVEACFSEVKVITCGMFNAYNEAVGQHNLG